ncbi:MAG: hypothetical protein AAFQ18_04155, partial [Pseudomonadota bacterium]
MGGLTPGTFSVDDGLQAHPADLDDLYLGGEVELTQVQSAPPVSYGLPGGATPFDDVFVGTGLDDLLFG